MRQFEKVVSTILTLLLFYSFIEIAFFHFGQLEYSPTLYLPVRVTSIFLVIFVLISAFVAGVFPLWNPYEYFRGMKLKKIIKFEKKYKMNYFKFFVGFISLLVCSGSHKIFDAYWWSGSILVILFGFWLILLPSLKRYIKPKKKEKEIETEIKKETKVVDIYSCPRC